MSASARRSSSWLPGHIGGSAGRVAGGDTANAPSRGLPKIPEPCKSEKTGRIIIPALKFAWVIFDKAISIRHLKADLRFERTGGLTSPSRGADRSIRGATGEAPGRRFRGLERTHCESFYCYIDNHLER